MLPRHAIAALVLLVGVAACSPGDNEIVFDNRTIATTAGTATPTVPIAEPQTPVDGLPAPLLVHLEPSTLRVIDETGEASFDRTEDAVFIAQPNWSPDGTRFAWVRADATGAGTVVVGNDGGVVAEHSTPYVPFYLHWRPDGAAIALLGTVQVGSGTGVGLSTLDVASGEVVTHYTGSPFYLHWSPDGMSIVAHHNEIEAHLYDVAAMSVDVLASTLGPFQAAQWAPDGSGVFYVRPGSEAIDAAAAPGVLAQTGGFGELVFHEVATGETEVVMRGAAILEFTVAPDGNHVAVRSATSAADGTVSIIELDTGSTSAVDGSIAEFMHWSPDSSKLLLMSYDLVSGRLTYRVWFGDSVTDYATTDATRQFLSAYLQFWGQYDRSHRLWAPDSSGFVYTAAEEGSDLVFFQRLGEETPTLVGPGSVATFPPIRP